MNNPVSVEKCYGKSKIDTQSLFIVTRKWGSLVLKKFCRLFFLLAFLSKFDRLVNGVSILIFPEQFSIDTGILIGRST